MSSYLCRPRGMMEHWGDWKAHPGSQTIWHRFSEAFRDHRHGAGNSSYFPVVYG